MADHLERLVAALRAERREHAFALAIEKSATENALMLMDAAVETCTMLTADLAKVGP